jgi:hypothetical protein
MADELFCTKQFLFSLMMIYTLKGYIPSLPFENNLDEWRSPFKHIGEAMRTDIID